MIINPTYLNLIAWGTLGALELFTFGTTFLQSSHAGVTEPKGAERHRIGWVVEDGGCDVT